jgi:transcriptional regulator with XRE-family HTH domain
VIRDIGYRIQRIREEKRLDAKRIADEIGVLHTSYSKIEREGTNSMKTLMKIANAMNVKMSDFFEDRYMLEEEEEKIGYATKEDVERLRRTLEAFIKNVEERLSLPESKKTYRKKNSLR